MRIYPFYKANGAKFFMALEGGLHVSLAEQNTGEIAVALEIRA